MLPGVQFKQQVNRCCHMALGASPYLSPCALPLLTRRCHQTARSSADKAASPPRGRREGSYLSWGACQRVDGWLDRERLLPKCIIKLNRLLLSAYSVRREVANTWL